MCLTSKINLSAHEICVLASLFGKDYVTGVERQLPFDEIIISDEEIQAVVNSLEQRGVIRYDFSGVVAIPQNIRRVLEQLTNPKSFLLIATSDDLDNRSTVYRFFAESYSIELTHKVDADFYEVSVETPISIEEYCADLLVHYGFQLSPKITSSMPAEMLLRAKGLLKEGQEQSVRTLLEQYFDEADAEEVFMSVLRDQYQSVLVKEYRRVGYRLILMSSDLISFGLNKGVRFRCEGVNKVKLEFYRREKR